MATVAQINANRRNALKSTGPKTPAGKVRSSRNALLHGLASKQIVLNTEDETAFQALYAEFHDEYQPATATERTLVQQVAIAAWRLRRIQTLETVLFDFRFVLEPGLWSSAARRRFDEQDPRWARFRQVGALLDGCSGSDALERLSRYEARVRRSFYAALAELRRRNPGGNPCRDREGGRMDPQPTKANEECAPAPTVKRERGASCRVPGAFAVGLPDGQNGLSTVPGTGAKPTEAIGQTQPSPVKSTTSRQIGFVPPNGVSPLFVAQTPKGLPLG
ncbi:MAG: hypothetical protein ACKV22_30360 [Bryobacteraceae bacterium]